MNEPMLGTVADDYFECPPVLPAADLPTLWVGLPGGQAARLPGTLWPEASAAGPALPISVVRVEKKVANGILERWGDHPLGPCNRLFGFEAYVLLASGEPCALAIGASTVSATMGKRLATLHRYNVVELARIARAPEHRHAMRPMLRLWREYVAPLWPQAQPRWKELAAAVSYQLPGTRGDIYRFDGWRCVGEVKPSGGGGTWSSKPVVNEIDDENKKLWVWEYAS